MVRPHVWMPVLALAFMGLAGYSQQSNTAGRNPSSAKADSGRDLTQLFSRIWLVTNAPGKAAPGSIYIFLANGTLLETSCVETYRIATWTIDKKTPSVLRVVEDNRLAFTAEITELTDSALRLRQNLARSNESRNITLKAIEQEFVCPDLPR